LNSWISVTVELGHQIQHALLGGRELILLKGLS